MIKKIIVRLTIVIALIVGFIFYFSLGKPAIFLQSLKDGLASGHTRALSIDTIGWLRYDDINKIRSIYPDLGEPLDAKGYLLILEGKFEFSGGYSDGKTGPVTQQNEGTQYVLRGNTRTLIFGQEEKPDYEKLSGIGPVRRLPLP